MLTDNSGLSPFERLLTLFTRIRPGEGRSTFLFFLHGFLLLFSYYIVRALREAFILTDYSAEVRSYGVAVIALVLMFVVPAYGAVRKRLDGERLLQAVTVFFALNMLGFSAAAYFGISTSFTFFVWVSIFGAMMIAQFWAFAADTFNLKSGQRLFPVIMVGANLGALAGAKFAAIAVNSLEPVGLMMVATLVLAATIVIAGPARAATPEGSRAVSPEHGASAAKLLGGIELVLRDRYLLLVALFDRAAELDQHHRRDTFSPHGVQRRRRAGGGICRHAGQGRRHHRLLRRLPFLGHARRTRDPAVARGPRVSLGWDPRRAARAADHRGTRLWSDGVRADLLHHPAGQDRGGQPSTTR